MVTDPKVSSRYLEICEDLRQHNVAYKVHFPTSGSAVFTITESLTTTQLQACVSWGGVLAQNGVVQILDAGEKEV